MIQKQTVRTERISLHLPTDTVESIKLLAAKNHTDMSKEIRRFIDKGLAVKSYEDNNDLISGIIEQELSLQIKKLGNRLAGLINRLTIISAAGYYTNITIMSELIDRDLYSSFEKIESAARKRALAYANQKNADAVAAFADDEEMKKAIKAIKGGINSVDTRI